MTDKPGRAELEIPTGLSLEDEAEWWEEHRDYWDSIDTEYEVLPPQKLRRTQHIDVWLPVDLIEFLKQEAPKQGTTYQVLAKRWLDERMAAEKKRKKRRGTKTRDG